jgi:hypothetical protein
MSEYTEFVRDLALDMHKAVFGWGRFFMRRWWRVKFSKDGVAA